MGANGLLRLKSRDSVNMIHPSVKPLKDSIESMLVWRKERIPTVCICGCARWEILDHIRRPLVDCHLVICPDCGFVTYSPQFPDLASWYRDQVRSQSIQFLETKTNKEYKHERLLFKWLKELGVKPLEVLDIGCSDGYLLKMIRERYKSQVTGIEVNPGHRNWGKYMDCLNIVPDLKEQKVFDLICCYHVFEHVQSPLDFLMWITRSLTDGGYLYLALPTLNRVLDNPVIEVFFKDEHINWFTDDYLVALLTSVGFKVEFIDKKLYGTAMLIKKVNCEGVRPKLYTQNRELIERLGQAYAVKRQADSVGNDRDKVRQMLQGSYNLFPRFPHLIIQYAETLDSVDKEDLLIEYHKNNPDMWEIKNQLAHHYYKQNSLDKAKQLFLELIDELGPLEGTVTNLAFIDYREGRKMEAIQRLSPIIDSMPWKVNLFNILASWVAEL